MKKNWILYLTLFLFTACSNQIEKTVMLTDFDLKQKCSTYLDAVKNRVLEYNNSESAERVSGAKILVGVFYSKAKSTCVSVVNFSYYSSGEMIESYIYTDELTGGSLYLDENTLDLVK